MSQNLGALRSCPNPNLRQIHHWATLGGQAPEMRKPIPKHHKEITKAKKTQFKDEKDTIREGAAYIRKKGLQVKSQRH